MSGVLGLCGFICAFVNVNYLTINGHKYDIRMKSHDTINPYTPSPHQTSIDIHFDIRLRHIYFDITYMSSLLQIIKLDIFVYFLKKSVILIHLHLLLLQVLHLIKLYSSFTKLGVTHLQ